MHWSHFVAHRKWLACGCYHYSVQFGHSVVPDSLRSHGLQHARPPCPSPTPGACSNSCPSSRWCHPTISFSVIPFSSHLHSFPLSLLLLKSFLKCYPASILSREYLYLVLYYEQIVSILSFIFMYKINFHNVWFFMDLSCKSYYLYK